MKIHLGYLIRVAMLLITCLIASAAYPQSIILKGKVVDSTTKQPVPFATISIQGTQQGSVANSDGAFDLIVSSKDSIAISCLGYTPLLLDVEAIQPSEQQIFELSIAPILLEEVIVTGERTQLSGEEIIKHAIKQQKNNFPANDYRISVFFRETNQIDDEYFKLVEAAATVHGKRFPNTSKKVVIDEIRSAAELNLAIPVNTEMNNYNPFREFQSLVGKMSNVRACKKCPYQIEDYISHEGRMVAMLASRGTNESYPRIFKLFIDMETFALVRMEFETHVPFGQGFPYTHEHYESSLVYLKRTFDYKQMNGRYYLNRYHQQLTHQYKSTKESLKDYQTTHNFHVMANHVLEGSNDLNDANEMNYKDKIIEASKSYDAEFWKHYNILKQTPLDQKIIEDIKKKKKASDQIFSQKK